MQAYFVTGTDTDVGKTLIATALLNAANQLKLSTAAVKPVAAGCEDTAEGLRNSDALLLQSTMSCKLSYQQVNPVALKDPIAPHIAAQREGRNLTVSRLVGFCRGVMMQRPEFMVVEGAGGWLVPLNNRETLADLARELELPVIMVVSMRLGCVNHALLTAQAISATGLPIAGWVANTVGEQMPCYQENIETLKRRIPAPLIGEVPYLSGASRLEQDVEQPELITQIANCLDMHKLLKSADS